MPTVALIACFWGFTDILRDISEDGSAQMSRNHEGITGLVLAARNGHIEVLDLTISCSFDFDVPDNKG
jgi:ankyrin repeat protein